MAKVLRNFCLRIDVNVDGGTKTLAFSCGQAGDDQPAYADFSKGVSCSGLPREITGGELAGTLGAFLAALQADLEGSM